MLGLPDHTSLRGSIFLLLARNGAASATWLQEKVSHQYRHCSLQAVYKELRSLQREGVVVKAQQRYSLSYRWIVNMLEFFDDVYERSLKHNTEQQLLPSDGEKRSWRFSSFQRTDDFWVQAIMAILRATPTRKALMWIPHPWFELIHHEKDLQFQTALRAMNYRLVMIVGGDTWLDRMCTHHWPADVYEYTHAVGPFEDEHHHSLLVSGDYVLRVKLDNTSNQIVDELFGSMTSAEAIELGRFMDVFKRSISANISIEQNATKARRLKKKFCKFWGYAPAEF